MALGKPVFTSKTYGAQLYKWSPQASDKKNIANKQEKPFYCNAVPYSQGQDWITRYSYDLAVSSIGVQEHLAYVECDYVQ